MNRAQTLSVRELHKYRLVYTVCIDHEYIETFDVRFRDEREFYATVYFVFSNRFGCLFVFCFLFFFFWSIVSERDYFTVVLGDTKSQ